MNRRDALGALGLAGTFSVAAAPEGAAQHPDGKRDMGPMGQAHLYLCAFHVAKNDPRFVVEAHHYCSPVREEVHQCVIFDSSGAHARILGVEYIISDALYRKLPADEKRYYHPHAYEILSGQLVAPGMAPEAEDKLLGGLIRSWGKTWHTWPDPRTALPLGEPLLMWSANKDGQVPESLLNARDQRLGISTAAIRKRRSFLGPVPQLEPPKSLNSLGRQFTEEGPDEPPK